MRATAPGPADRQALPPVYEPVLGEVPVAPVVDLSRLNWQRGLLLRSPNWLGDAVMSLPAAYRLAQLVPASAGCWVVAPRKLADFWACVPWVDKVFAFDGKRFGRALRRELAAAAPDATVIFPNSFGSALDLRRARLPNLIGRAGRGRGRILHHRLPPWHRRAGEDRHHQVTEFLALSVACGSEVPSDILRFPPPRPILGPTDARLLDERLPVTPRLLAIAPGAAYGPAKQWPAEHFRAVCQWWEEAEDGAVVAVGAPGEEDAAAAALGESTRHVNLAGKTNLQQLLAVLTRATAVVANDSGVMHLAAALGKRGVALFGSTDPVATGPVGGRWLVLSRDLPCAPCLERTCPLAQDRYACLRGIPPTQVEAALERLLAEPSS